MLIYSSEDYELEGKKTQREKTKNKNTNFTRNHSSYPIPYANAQIVDTKLFLI